MKHMYAPTPSATTDTPQFEDEPADNRQIPHTTRIRIGYLGKILKEGSPLASQGWKEGHVVNALMFDTR